MTDRTIGNIRELGSDYFRLYYSKKGGKKLGYYLDQFDINDYWIYKSSNKFREVSIEDLLEFKYATYMLFNKDLYDREVINDWIDVIYSFGDFRFLSTPFPPEYVKKKIRIIE